MQQKEKQLGLFNSGNLQRSCRELRKDSCATNLTEVHGDWFSDWKQTGNEAIVSADKMQQEQRLHKKEHILSHAPYCQKLSGCQLRKEKYSLLS